LFLETVNVYNPVSEQVMLIGVAGRVEKRPVEVNVRFENIHLPLASVHKTEFAEDENST
jgi:hypothetical protein